MPKSAVQLDGVTDPSQSRPLRPLLPAQPQPIPASDDAMNDHQSPTPVYVAERPRVGSTAKDRPTRQQIAAACTNCQRKKCKCDGEKPCRPCQKHNLECVYTYEAGVTRSRALKRKNEALSEDNNQLRYIVQGLRGGTEEEAKQILKRIRESLDVDDAVSLFAQAALLMPNGPPTNPKVPRITPSDNHTRPSASTSSSTSPVSRRAPTLEFLLNPVTDDSTHGTSSYRQGTQSSSVFSPPMPYPAGHTNGRMSSHTDTVSSSSVPPSERPKLVVTREMALVRWIQMKEVMREDPQAQKEAPGTADRLNALLDGLPFLYARPETPTITLVQNRGDAWLPVIFVSARPWTMLTDDDEFVSQLICLFFTWEQPWYNYVEMNSFLADMKSGADDWTGGAVPEREFCSPCLVNAILAMGCLSSRHPSAYYIPGDPLTRGQHFVIEAERLIRAENGRAKLTTLLAIWLTMWYRSCSGYKFRSSDFAGPFYEMYEELGLGGRILRPWDYESNEKSKRSFDSKSEIIWGIYCHDATLAIANGCPAYIQRPMIEKTFERDIKQTDSLAASHLWWPYPEPRTPEPSLRHLCLSAKVYLTDINHEVFAFQRGAPAHPTTPAQDTQRIAEAMRIYQKFVAWRDSLPEALGSEGSKLPHIILLRASYDVSVITLFRSLQRGPGEDGDVWEQARFRVISHSQSLMSIMNYLRDNWTLFRHCYAMQAHWLPAFALLFHLRLGEPVADVFSQAIKGLHEVGEKWVVAAWMLQIVGFMAEEYELQLPKDCLKWLDISPALSMGEDSSDVMLPVTIPEHLQLQHPLLLNLQEGTYLNDIHSVFARLQQTRMDN